jgi:hypothetical protein
MKFNKFLWDNYLLSDDAKEWSSFFANLSDLYLKKDKRLQVFLTNRILSESGPWSSSADIEEDMADVYDSYEDLKLNIGSGKDDFPLEISSDQERDAFFQRLYAEKFKNEEDPDDEYELSYHDIPTLSVALFLLYPDWYFPYFFYPNMEKLQKIFNTFSIFLPAVPSRSAESERFFYYLELCKSMRNFWVSHGLSPRLIPVFLYGFCPKVLEDDGDEKLLPLPKPKRAIFIGGGVTNGDAARLDLVTADAHTNWGGGKDSNPGDIVIMYLLAPRSEIHSIWRATHSGSVEPFFHYYGTCKIGYPVKVPPIHLSEIKKDPVLSGLGLVRGNMQGINGRTCPKLYYDRILSILEEKGFDISQLPQLVNVEREDVSLKNERDVELQILEPLLKELSYVESDWKRQVKLQVGRSEKVIPDYLVKVKNDTKQISAEWVWEAKFSITNHKQLDKDFLQVVSYANLVQAKGVSLISKEGLWICSAKDQFNLKKAMHIPAVNLFETDSLSEIRSIIRRA